MIAKDRLQESSSQYAQGGIAAALSDDDDISLHEQDTLVAGDGLCDREAVHTLVEEAPAAIQELLDWGAAFDREGAQLLFAREGAHSRNRVLHAYGDSTGREIQRTLHTHASSLPSVRFQSFATMTDLLLHDGAVAGAVALETSTGRCIPIYAGAVLLATGGLGRIYLNTTNPDVATGDGVAMAYRAGAEISDIEFVQFHPTALYIPGAPRFLLSEALRGEGAYLRNIRGERFMERYHPLGELAPRDVVSRSIVSEMRLTAATHVLLDLTHLDPTFVPQRFPRIYQTCLSYGIDLTREPAPVQPAAHYSMGGVRTDLHGQTTLPRLYAAGEVACTGVHGANRLASNSLLEGVVFGKRAGDAMREGTAGRIRSAKTPGPMVAPPLGEDELRTLAWEQCGILRTGDGLQAALKLLAEAVPRTCRHATRTQHELRNIYEIIQLVAQCALAREESRGGHFRSDYPAKNPAFQKHSVIAGGAVRFEESEPQNVPA